MSQDTDQEILSELRKVKTIGQRVFWLLAVCLVILIVQFSIPGRYKPASVSPSWDAVAASVRRQDFQKALREAQSLVAQQPDYYYGHSYLGMIYLATGDVTKAEQEYATAYRLFPTEQGEKDLNAVRKRAITILQPSAVPK